MASLNSMTRTAHRRCQLSRRRRRRGRDIDNRHRRCSSSSSMAEAIIRGIGKGRMVVAIVAARGISLARCLPASPRSSLIPRWRRRAGRRTRFGGAGMLARGGIGGALQQKWKINNAKGEDRGSTSFYRSMNKVGDERTGFALLFLFIASFFLPFLSSTSFLLLSSLLVDSPSRGHEGGAGVALEHADGDDDIKMVSMSIIILFPLDKGDVMAMVMRIGGMRK